MRAMLGLAALLVCASVLEGAVLRPIAVDEFFVTPGKPAVLRWSIESEKFAAPLDYVVRDYWGREAATGRAKVTDGKAAKITVTLGAGFFDVEFPAAKERFGVLSLPASEGKTDPFFAIDSAMSWLVRDDAVREGLVKGLRRSGVGMSRERVSWSQIHKQKAERDWETDRRYETLRKAHARLGVTVLEMFHDSPAWPGRIEKYPDDLVAAARSWEAIAKRWRGTWGALEVWNEPDIFFGGNLPADQYVAMVKTFAWVWVRTNTNMPLVGGSFAHYNPRYLDNAARNGLLDCVDVASFHTYGHAGQMEGLVGKYRAWLRAHGKGAMPLWITECGRPWKRGPERPPADEGRASALDITMKAVEARAGGIAVHFPFVYPYYEERTSNFGMMGKRATPLRAMAAYAQMVRALAHKRYLGDLACDGVQRARVFGDDRETVAVLYTGRPEAAKVVALGTPTIRAEGIDGRPLEIAQDGAARVPDGLTYVWLDRKRLGDRLKADTSAVKLYAALQEPEPARPAPSPIVLRFQYDRSALAHRTEGYRIKAVPPGAMRLGVRAFNLSGEARRVVLSFALSRESAKVRGAAERAVTIPPQGHVDAAWEADLSRAFATSDWITATVSAEGEGVGRVLPLSVDLMGEPSLAQIGGRYKQRVRLPIGDVASWQANICGDGRMTMKRTADGHWRLDATFGEGDPWVYPYFTLPKAVDLRRATALTLRARCHKPGVVRVFLWEGNTGVGYITPAAVIPADGQWHTAIVHFHELNASGANRPDPNGKLDLGTVRRISIGLNSLGKTAVLEVSDVFAVGEP